jgi:hypothetical protein
MAARTFTDSTGLTWSVFEVHRASQKAGAVSPGLENGWLAFASGDTRRRLAPFPSTWESSTDAELERLCETARRVDSSRFPADRVLRPRIWPSRLDSESTGLVDSPANVEAAVRVFARQARARGITAVAAMLELKSLLQQRYPEPQSAAHDRQRIRRWFVEAYYFERERGDEPLS